MIARSPTVRSAIRSAAADRRDEAIVERLRDSQAAMDAIPAEPDRQLVGAQLAGVEETEQLDAREVGLEQLAVLALVVFAQVPGVVGLLRAGGRECEAVGRRDVGDGCDRR